MENNHEKVAVIGLGAMGYQMARHLVNAGFKVNGCDVVPEAVQRLAETTGATICSSPVEIDELCQTVIVMVATDAQVDDVVVKSGLLDRLKPGAVICVASSCSPTTAQALEQICNEREIGLLDTPVVLGQQAANDGTLTTFVGGTEEAFDRARPALQAFSGQVLHVGGSGMGQLTKTINNLLLWSCMSANYEALSFAKKAGADIPKLVDALQHSSGANWSLSRWGKSTGKWAEKDMDVALDLAQSLQQPVPLTALVDQLMKGMNQEKMKALLD